MGTVFKLDQDGSLTVLYNFIWPTFAYPNAGLIMDNHGNLYGTTERGGPSLMGTVFMLTP
jgi:uncharacterized repeat protein (TIGR03803 family)